MYLPQLARHNGKEIADALNTDVNKLYFSIRVGFMNQDNTVSFRNNASEPLRSILQFMGVQPTHLQVSSLGIVYSCDVKQKKLGDIYAILVDTELKHPFEGDKMEVLYLLRTQVPGILPKETNASLKGYNALPVPQSFIDI